ncbi:MAG TPA: NUDIX domain-containing protein [Candidatus Nanoarchaeia archaeon]|nr:NUDIX domain-containing protein [Candidatus Nanoarchaeia archaeon]
MGDINWKNKCWVTTIYLVKDSKVLLTWNKNLQTWIPVGGHMDPGETPEEAIKREVEEEVGCSFVFHPEPKEECNGNVRVLSPLRIQIDKVPHHGQHINIKFAGKVTKWKEVSETDEQEKLKWFSKEDLTSDKGMLESVRNNALEALRLVR